MAMEDTKQNRDKDKDKGHHEAGDKVLLSDNYQVNLTRLLDSNLEKYFFPVGVYCPARAEPENLICKSEPQKQSGLPWKPTI